MGQGGSPLLAAAVNVPNMQSGYNHLVDYPELPETFPHSFIGGPQKGTKARYKAVGEFGEFKDAEEAAKYKEEGMYDGVQYGGFSPRSQGMIRGFMDFVPGGIPASEGFNYDATVKKYSQPGFPNIMEGIPRGNMPVYRTY